MKRNEAIQRVFAREIPDALVSTVSDDVVEIELVMTSVDNDHEKFGTFCEIVKQFYEGDLQVVNELVPEGTLVFRAEVN